MKKKYSIKDITPSLLSMIMDRPKEGMDEQKHIFLRKSWLAEMLGVSTTTLLKYSLEEGSMPKEKRQVVAELLTEISKFPTYKSRMEYIRKKKHTLKKDRKTVSRVKKESEVIEMLENYLTNQGPNSEILREISFTDKESNSRRISLDLLLINHKKKTVEIIEVKICSSINESVLYQGIEQLSFYLLALQDKLSKKYKGYKIQGHLVCNKASDSLVDRAKMVGIIVSQYQFSLNVLTN